MCEAKFTKGPWLPPKGGVTKFIDARIGSGMLQEVCSVGPTQETDQQLANANLIATAPEMYEELQEVSNWLNTQLGMGEWHNDIEKLLAKARGEHV